MDRGSSPLAASRCAHTLRAVSADLAVGPAIRWTSVAKPRPIELLPRDQGASPETIGVIGGRFEMTVDGERRELTAGETIHIPAGVNHSGRNLGTGPGRRAVVFSPGGMERFFLEVGQADPDAEIDLQAAVEASARYGWEFD